MGTDTVAVGLLTGVIFTQQLELEAKDNDYNACIILKGFSLPGPLACMRSGSEVVVEAVQFPQLPRDTFTLLQSISSTVDPDYISKIGF